MDTAVTRALGALSRRVRTLIVSGIAFLVLLVLALTLPVPYVILSPGPTCNTLGDGGDCNEGDGSPVIQIEGVSTQSKYAGNLNLTTVGVSGSELTIFDALSAWLQHDQVVVPRSTVYPPGQSDEQTNKQNAAEFATSQSSAVTAAACFDQWQPGFGVQYLLDKSPSQGKLRIGDALVSVDGKSTDSYDKLKAVLSTLTPGKTVAVQVTHAAQGDATASSATEQVTLGKPLQGAKGASLGIAVTPDDKTCLTPYHVTLGLGQDIGGPSAGLMFTLGILDKVGIQTGSDKVAAGGLTGGTFIAGTGTIDDQGNVGPIGGIQLKMIAARDQGASVFLAPADNCGDVSGNIPSGLQVVKVSTLQGAVDDLLKLKDKQPVLSC